MRKVTEDTDGKHAVLIRLPLALHKKLKEQAEQEHRSVHGHITYLLTRGVEE